MRGFKLKISNLILWSCEWFQPCAAIFVFFIFLIMNRYLFYTKGEAERFFDRSWLYITAHFVVLPYRFNRVDFGFYGHLIIDYFDNIDA